MKKNKIMLSILPAAAVICSGILSYCVGTDSSYFDKDGKYREITSKESFGHVEDHPAFKKYKEYIIPWKDKVNEVITPFLSMRFVCKINHYDTEAIINGFNFMLEMDQEGKNRYYHFYDESEVEINPEKAVTGIIFIPGEENAPFALIVPGGGMTCICAFAEGFPVAKELHKKGYNVFLLQYRVSPSEDEDMMKHIEKQQKYANEDFGKAVQYIFENAERWGVGKDNYSVWGFSAGGQLCQLWGMDNEYGYEAYGMPSPTVSVLAYSGWIDEGRKEKYNTEPPTFLAYTINDKVIGQEAVQSIKNYGKTLRKYGVAEEFVCKKARHGFGTGAGTDAEGWIEKAISFWENNS